MSHVPKEVLARNFQTDISAFNEIPGEQLYIFPGSKRISHTVTYVFSSATISAPPADNAQPPSDPQGQIPEPFAYQFSKVAPTQYSGGTAKIADTTVFNVSQEVAVAEITVQPGAMR